MTANATTTKKRAESKKAPAGKGGAARKVVKKDAKKPTVTKNKKAGEKKPAKKGAVNPRSKAIKKEAKKQPRLRARRSIIRGASSAWIQFSNSERDKLKKELPDLSFGQQSQVLSARWKTMSEEQKKPFHDLHQKDLDRFKQQRANLSPEEQKMLRMHRRRQREKNEGKPSTALSAYMIFVKEKRNEVVSANPNIKFADVGAKLGALWQSYDEAARAPFYKKAAEDRVRYDNEMKVYRIKKDKEKAENAARREAERKAAEARKAANAAQKKAKEAAEAAAAQ